MIIHKKLLSKFLIFFIIISNSIYSYANQIIESKVAPKSAFNFNTTIFEGLQIDEKINECINNPFKEEYIEIYEKLIHTGLSIFKGYSMYNGIKNTYNYLNINGMKILEEFIKFQDDITKNEIEWEKVYTEFLLLIQKIPRATINHSAWNLDLFIDVFEMMSDNEIHYLTPHNKIAIQLSRTCPNQCLHCAAIAKDRKLSSLEHMPLPIALKIINKIAQNNNPLFILYDKSDIAYYFDNVLKMDALPIMHFINHKKLQFSSITQGSNQNNNLFINYLPALISFHPFHRKTLNYIIRKLKSKKEDLNMERESIIKNYINKFLDTTKSLDIFPGHHPFYTYQGGLGPPITSFRKYNLNLKTRNIIENDPNGKYTLTIIDEILQLQDEIYERFMNKFNKSRGLLALVDEDYNSNIEFAGMGAFLLKTLGISDETIKKLKLSTTSNLYNTIEYVIEADGRISFIVPERYKPNEYSPHRKIQDIFDNSISYEFKLFFQILKIIKNGKIDKQLRIDSFFKELCQKLNISNYKINYDENSSLISFETKNFINIIKYFIAKDKILNEALNDMNNENLLYVYEKLKKLPIPTDLRIFESNDILKEATILTLNLKTVNPDIFFHRKSFPFEWVYAFKGIPNEKLKIFKKIISNNYVTAA